jgi:hypothetical protein
MASFLDPVRELMRLDLPAFERPINAIWGVKLSRIGLVPLIPCINLAEVISICQHPNKETAE